MSGSGQDRGSGDDGSGTELPPATTFSGSGDDTTSVIETSSTTLVPSDDSGSGSGDEDTPVSLVRVETFDLQLNEKVLLMVFTQNVLPETADATKIVLVSVRIGLGLYPGLALIVICADREQTVAYLTD